MTADRIEALFTRQGVCAFARWRRPIVPVVFGVEDATRRVFKRAMEAVATLAGHPVAEVDPELGANLMICFLRDRAELTEVPGLAHLLPAADGPGLRLQAAGANPYRVFRFDPDGAIRAAFVFLRMNGTWPKCRRKIWPCNRR